MNKPEKNVKKVLAPTATDIDLWHEIRALRQKNYQVIETLPDENTASYDYVLERIQGSWQLVAVNH